MDKSQFVSTVAKAAQVPAAQVSAVLKGIESVVVQEVRASGKVRIPGVATVQSHERGERLVRNPRTGQESLMGPSTVVRIKPVAGLSDAIKGLTKN